MDFSSNMAINGYSSYSQNNHGAWDWKDKHTGSGVVSGTQGHKPESHIGKINHQNGIDSNLSSIFENKAKMARDGLGGTNDPSGHKLFLYA